MNKKITFCLIIGFVLLIGINNIWAITIMEPVIEDLKYKSVVDIGLTAPGEQVLVSFHQGVNGTFSEIRLAPESRDLVILENTRRTRESIFTTINIKENIKGSKNINLYLIGESERKITLRTTVTNEVVYAYVLDYDVRAKADQIKEIPIRLINKSSSTKEVVISSDITKHWFSDEIKQTKRILLQPKSITDITYEFMPKIVGEKTQEIYLFLDTSKRVQVVEEASKENIILEIKIDITKDLNSIQNTKKHVFTLYGLNILPAHFFNNFLRYLIN